MKYTVLLSIVIAGTIISLSVIFNLKSDHEKVMELIEERKALLEIDKSIETRRIVKWADSMDLVIQKKIYKNME